MCLEQPPKKYILDTNVLFFVNSGYHFSESDPKKRKSELYSECIGQLKRNDATIYVSVLSLQELFHLVERTEYDFFINQNHLDKKQYSFKKFRANEAERKKLAKKLDQIYQEISCLYTICNANILESHIGLYIKEFDKHRFDPIDYILTKNFDVDSHIFITDDRDFQCKSEIKVMSIEIKDQICPDK